MRVALYYAGANCIVIVHCSMNYGFYLCFWGFSNIIFLHGLILSNERDSIHLLYLLNECTTVRLFLGQQRLRITQCGDEPIHSKLGQICRPESLSVEAEENSRSTYP
jgi:hypothetical protein